MPKVVQFSPRGRPGRPDEIELPIDQFEAIKLADYQGFTQSQGALAMRLSRASFGRILREARRRIADALTHGKIIKIRMGNVQIGVTKTDLTTETIHDELKRFKKRSQRMAEEIRGINMNDEDVVGDAQGTTA
jgi:predicted DNA-binding protein (UPF0251 family)